MYIKFISNLNKKIFFFAYKKIKIKKKKMTKNN